MKSKFLPVLTLGVALLLTGCWQKSLHPFYKEGDVAFEEKLIGTWHEEEKEADKGMRWFVTKVEGKSAYRIKIEADDTKLDYDGHLFRLGNERLLNLFSRGRPIAEIPAHNLFKIESIEGGLKVRILNPDWIKKRLQEKPDEIAHIKAYNPEEPNDADKSEIILTATTEQLQKFIRDHDKDNEFWSDTVAFKVIQPK